jgi:hypothetical protein
LIPILSFFSILNTEEKIKQLCKRVNNLSDKRTKKLLLEWFDHFNELRKMRNIVIHSIILKNISDDNDYILFNYKKEKNGSVKQIVKNFSTDDFNQLDKKIIEVHNSGSNLLDEIQKNTTIKSSVFPI